MLENRWQVLKLPTSFSLREKQDSDWTAGTRHKLEALVYNSLPPLEKGRHKARLGVWARHSHWKKMKLCWAIQNTPFFAMFLFFQALSAQRKTYSCTANCYHDHHHHKAEECSKQFQSL